MVKRGSSEREKQKEWVREDGRMSEREGKREREGRRETVVLKILAERQGSVL